MKYLELIRVKHWIKNILVFIPMVCASAISKNNIITTILGFIAFSFLSSTIYIINDIRDIEEDKKHPRKKNRPLPSGKIKISTSLLIALFLLIISIGLNTYICNSLLNISFYILISYLVINILYSFGLKDVAIIDVMLLASGFILRTYYGAKILDISVSSWLFLTIMNASIFLGLGKRKKEILKTKKARKVLEAYNEAFLDKFQYLTLTLCFVFYSLWTIDQHIKYLIFTIPLLMIIFMKYCLILETNDEGDPTTVLYQDKSLIGLCAIYGIVMLLILVVI